MHEIDHFLIKGSEDYAEALGYFPEVRLGNLESQHYLQEIRELKKRVSIPIIASLNGVSKGGWEKYAKELESAGVDAIELNITYIPTDINTDAREVENLYIEALKVVKEMVRIPVSVKMNAYFSAPAQMAKRLAEAGAAGLVLFDRPVHVDIDLENLNATQTITKSSSKDMSESLRWCAILYKKLPTTLCASTGVRTHEDILKAMMSGADAVQMVHAVLENKAEHIQKVLHDLTAWMEEKEYVSIEQMKGSISLHHTTNPAAFQRVSYMRLLTDYRY